jgi:hypothetical protein
MSFIIGGGLSLLVGGHYAFAQSFRTDLDDHFAVAGVMLIAQHISLPLFASALNLAVNVYTPGLLDPLLFLVTSPASLRPVLRSRRSSLFGVITTICGPDFGLA